MAVQGVTPIVFLSGRGRGRGRGVAPLMPGAFPIGITPFGITDSDIKGPSIPKPMLFALKNRVQVVTRARPLPMPAPYLRIYGITKDSTSAILANCTVSLFETVSRKFVESAVSDANGVYEFRSASLSTAYYVVAYKVGSPDVAGTTVNTLVGT